jgi:predicted AlkP superfamily pyrophosphatase or phosphodiesterase
MYNPDAIAQWIYEKYPQLVKGAKNRAEIEIPLCSVMPSVTPVCFGTMYTGAQPAVHGIRKYEKPVIKIDSIFDAALRAGKKCAIVSYGKSSLSHIFLERDMDYFLFPEGGVDAVNAKAAELIMRDEHDLIVIYNGNYDSVMHKKGPEGLEALCELRSNDHTFSELCELIERHMSHRNVLCGFAMDHGCHEIDGDNGSHGLDMEEDLNIVHLYKGYKKK